MATLVNVIRWADNTDQLKRNLAEGLNQVEALTAATERMVKGFSGERLLQSANNMTAAIDKMGGATKLTGAEQDRVNGLLEKAIEKYRALGREAPPALQALYEATRKTASASEQLIAGMSGIGKKALESQALIAGMSAQAQQSIKRVVDASAQMVAGMSAVGQKAAQSGQIIAGMSASGQAGVLQLAAAAEKPINVFGRLASVARALGPALGIGFSAAAVVNFAKEALASADALQKMADRTGIGVEGLQRLQLVGDDAGNTIEQLSGAINMMQRRLADGDTSALAALTRLGLSFEEIRRLSPDQQFMAIGDALRRVQDPADQVNLAMDLFGRTGAEVLPSIKRGFDDVRDASVGMSADTVKALDEAGDALDRWVRRTKGVLATALAAWIEFEQRRQAAISPDIGPPPEGATRLTPLEQATIRAPQMKTAQEFAAETSAALLRAAQADINAQSVIEHQLNRTNAERLKAAEADGKRREAAERMRETELAMGRQALMTSESLRGLAFTGGMIADSYELARRKMDAFTAVRPTATKFGLDEFFQIGRVDSPADIPFQQTLSTAFGSTAQALPSLLIKSFTGGGGLKGAAQAIGTTFGQNLFGANGAFANVTTKLTGGLSKMFGSTIGGALGAALPGIGSLIGPGIQLAIAGIKKLFGGPSAQELAGRDIKRQIQDSFGGFDQMMATIATAYQETGRSAELARADVERLMRAEKDGAEAVKAVWADINRAFDEQKQDAADLEAAVRKYGFTIEELGPKLQKQQLDEQAKVLINDWRLLVGAGIDVTTVNSRMASAINDYLKLAIRTATEVPAAMKPMLQTMIDQGTLIDANGNKITDLTSSGITFAETMTQGFDRVVNALNRVLVGLGLIPEALNDIPTERRINVRVQYDDPGPTFDGGPYEREEFHSGGLIERMHRGTARVLPFIKAHTGLAADEVPIIAQTGEAILNRNAVSSLGNDTIRALNNGAGVGGDVSILANKFDRLASAIEAFLHELLLNERTTIFVDGKQMDVRTEIIPQFYEALKSNDRHALTELKATLGIAA